MKNFFSEEMRRNPYPIYERLRSSSPVLHDPEGDLWMIFDYEGVKRALNDHDAFGSSIAAATLRTPDWLVFLDPPRHTKLRALISQAFTPRVVANLEPRIRELSRELVDRIIDRGEMDMAGDFAVPLPMMVIAALIGIPPAERERFKRWSDVILKLSFTVSGEDETPAALVEVGAVRAEMNAYLTERIAERRASPRDDLLTKLVEAEVDGERLTQKDILGFFILLLVAGSETTTNLINNAILCFVEHPEELARLRAAPELLPSAIVSFR